MNIHENCKIWIFEDREMDPEREALMRAHLRECDECRRLKENLALGLDAIRSAPPKSPAPGFPARFQAMQAERMREKERVFRVRVFFIICAIVGILSLFLFMLLLLPQNLSELLIHFSKEATRFSSFLCWARTIFDVFRAPILILSFSFTLLASIYSAVLFLSALTFKNMRSSAMEKDIVYEK